ncbi:MAG: type II toxin-antitoxin system HicA family toxin [Candidatus Absconditabacterales bacterium]
MPKIYSARKILNFFEKEGFHKVSQKGSHIKLKNASGTIIIVPIHSKDVPYGTFRAIVDQSGLDSEYVIATMGK